MLGRLFRKPSVRITVVSVTVAILVTTMLFAFYLPANGKLKIGADGILSIGLGTSSVKAADPSDISFLSGLELGDFSEWSSYTGSPSVVEANGWGSPNTGTYALRCNPSSSVQYVDSPIISNPQDTISCYILIASAPTGSDAPIIGWGNNAGAIWLTTDRYIDLYYNGTKYVDGTTQLSLDTWYHIEYVALATANETYVYVNGVEELYDSNDWHPFDYIGVYTTSGTFTVDIYYDDIVISSVNNAGQFGAVKVQPVIPNGEGYYQEHGSGTYASLTDIPADTADYVFIEANGSLLSYLCDIQDRADLGLSTDDTIMAVSTWFYYETDGGGGVDEYFHLVRSGSTDYATSVDDPKIPTWENRLDAVDPYTSTDWTWTNYDAFEVGMETDDANKDLWIYDITVMLAYIPDEGDTFDISNAPSSEALGVVADSTTYYAYGSAPSNPVTDGECTFTITNNGSVAFDVDMSITDFTGGTTWNIVSGSPSTNECRVTAYYSGQDPASGLVLANTAAEFYDALAASGTIKWDFKIEFGVLTNEANLHTATITLAAVAED